MNGEALSGPGAMGAVSSGVGMATILLVFAWSIGRALAQRRVELRRARQELESSRQAEALPPLEAGPAVVHGTVERAADQPVAARVEVDQLGTETESSGSWTTSWTETDRRVTTRPFYLRRGEDRVRVDPTEGGSGATSGGEGRVFLVDAMDGLILVDTFRRTRFAELTPGERVHAVGVLRREADPERDGGAYRSPTGLGWVLRPDPVDGLLLSSERLDVRFRRRANAERWAAILYAVGALFFGLCEVEYLARAVLGEDVDGTIVRSFVVASGDDSPDDHVLQARAAGDPPTARELMLPASEEAANAAVPGAAVPIRVVRSWRGASGIGPGARVSWSMFPVGAGFFVMAYIVVTLIRRASRKWYDGVKVVDSASGRLKDNARATSVT